MNENNKQNKDRKVQVEAISGTKSGMRWCVCVWGGGIVIQVFFKLI